MGVCGILAPDGIGDGRLGVIREVVGELLRKLGLRWGGEGVLRHGLLINLIL